MKNILWIIILWIVPYVGFGQKIELDWIELSGNQVIVHYNLEDSNPNHQYLISLYTSEDNYRTALTRVSGDVGPEVRPGRDKKITWEITKELLLYKGDLQFEVRGRVFIPYVKLVNFPGGQVFKRGTNTALNWESGNLNGEVNIELFKNQERIPVENNASNSGRYDWYIPGNLKKGNDYKLRFTNSEDRDDYMESPTFTIKPKVPLLLKVLGVGVVGGGLSLIAGSGGGSGTNQTPLPGNPGLPGN